MTKDPSDQPAPPGPDGFREGIYLETKKSSIGTGGTAKTAEYRSFWATVSLAGDSALMLLLDDDFKPTAIKQDFPLQALAGPDWFFVPEGEKRYQRLRPFLDQLREAQRPSGPSKEEPPQQEPPRGRAAQPASKGAKWWEGPPSDGPPANPFELKKNKDLPAPKKGGWWEK